MNKVLWECMG